MVTRRQAIGILGSISATTLFVGRRASIASTLGTEHRSLAAQGNLPSLAPGTPTSPKRMALIAAFSERSDGLEKRFQARTHRAIGPQRPRLLAAAVICCGAETADDVAASVGTPVWNFHGDSDRVAPVEFSRDRMTSMRKAGGRPIHAEYAGLGHNVWQWAFTEPALVDWVFSHRRTA